MRTRAAQCVPRPQPAPSLSDLRERISCIESGRADGGAAALGTGWREIDDALPDGGLRLGAIHEWTAEARGDRSWSAPLLILAHLARRAISANDDARIVCWIGRSVWPYGTALVTSGDRALMRRSLFIDPSNDAERVWAIDLALRSGAVAAVVADGSRLAHTATRRLQLAAESNGALGVLARPPTDIAKGSAAMTRWRVSPAPSDRFAPRWNVECVRCKGGELNVQTPRRWTVELTDAGHLVVPSNLADRPDAEADGAAETKRHHALNTRRSA